MRLGIILPVIVGAMLSFVVMNSQPVAAEAQPGGNSIVVQSIPGPTVIEKIAQRTEVSWPWYLTRASGVIAMGALIVLILSGIGFVTGHSFKFLEPLTAWASHRALGITFGVAILVHMLTLLFDHFVSFSVLDLLVPWLSTYHPVTIAGIQFGSLFVALGVLAFYGVALIIITSLVWVEKKPKLWKFIHLVSYLILVFVFVHALFIGTDFADGIPRFLLIVAGFILAIAILLRLRRARTI